MRTGSSFKCSEGNSNGWSWNGNLSVTGNINGNIITGMFSGITGTWTIPANPAANMYISWDNNTTWFYLPDKILFPSGTYINTNGGEQINCVRDGLSFICTSPSWSAGTVVNGKIMGNLLHSDYSGSNYNGDGYWDSSGSSLRINWSNPEQGGGPWWVFSPPISPLETLVPTSRPESPTILILKNSTDFTCQYNTNNIYQLGTIQLPGNIVSSIYSKISFEIENYSNNTITRFNFTHSYTK